MRISEYKHPAIKELLGGCTQSPEIDSHNVFQEANLKNRACVDEIIAPLLLPGSKYQGIEDLLELYSRAQKGESCLILMEHYSNFDLPNFFYLCKKHSKEAEQAVNSVIAMAGAKLNQESTFVRAFTEAYSRIVIFPSRLLDKLRLEGDAKKQDVQKGRQINMAALHEMVRSKHSGHIILVFPAGTRYRPGDESTRRGLKEMDSYIKSFDHVLFVAIAGNTLKINGDTGAMSDDLVEKDEVIYYSEGLVSSQSFRDSVKDKLSAQDDPKQAGADAIMKRLEELHGKAESFRNQAAGA